jgi:hypothetical protein
LTGRLNMVTRVDDPISVINDGLFNKTIMMIILKVINQKKSPQRVTQG